MNTQPTMTRISTVADGAVLPSSRGACVASLKSGLLNIVEQGHEAVVHVELLVTVK
jgi:hypothetical protein